MKLLAIWKKKSLTIKDKKIHLIAMDILCNYLFWLPYSSFILIQSFYLNVNAIYVENNKESVCLTMFKFIGSFWDFYNVLAIILIKLPNIHSLFWRLIKA